MQPWAPLRRSAMNRSWLPRFQVRRRAGAQAVKPGSRPVDREAGGRKGHAHGQRPVLALYRQWGRGWRTGLRGVPEDQVELVSLDPKRRRDGRIGRDALGLVGVQGEQNLLIDEEARPG